MSHMPGFGDSSTWPAIGNHGDPQTWGFRQPTDDDDSGETWYEQIARLIEEIREELAIAEHAAMHRDEQKAMLAMLNVRDVVGELWPDGQP